MCWGRINSIAIMVCSLKKEVEEDWKYLTKILITHGICGGTSLEGTDFEFMYFIKLMYIYCLIWLIVEEYRMSKLPDVWKNYSLNAGAGSRFHLIR